MQSRREKHEEAYRRLMKSLALGEVSEIDVPRPDWQRPWKRRVAVDLIASYEY